MVEFLKNSKQLLHLHEVIVLFKSIASLSEFLFWGYVALELPGIVRYNISAFPITPDSMQLNHKMNI